MSPNDDDRHENEAILNARRRMALVAETYGDRHPEYATALNQLALLLIMQQEPERAEPLLREALEIRRQGLGEAHPDFATNLSSLGGLLWARDDYEGAEPLLRQAVEIRRKSLGAAHPKTVVSINSLEQFYKQRAKHEALRTLDDLAAVVQAAEPPKVVIGQSAPAAPGPVIRIGGGYTPNAPTIAARPEGPLPSMPVVRTEIPVVTPSQSAPSLPTVDVTSAPAANSVQRIAPPPVVEPKAPPVVPVTPPSAPAPLPVAPASVQAVVSPPPVPAPPVPPAPVEAVAPPPAPVPQRMGGIDQFAAQIEAIRSEFETWSGRLQQEAGRMRIQGTPPSAEFLQAWPGIEARFHQVVGRGKELARDHDLDLPSAASLTVDDAVALVSRLREAEQRIAEAERLRTAALGCLRKAEAISFVDRDAFAPLTAFQKTVASLHASITAARPLRLPAEAGAIAHGAHPIASLVEFVAADAGTSDDRWAELFDRVEDAFGSEMAVAAARRRLLPSS